MHYPAAWPFILVALGAFRLVRLVGWDDLTISLRRKATGLSDAQHAYWAHGIDEAREDGFDLWTLKAGATFTATSRRDDGTFEEYLKPPISPARFYFSKLIRCPWCVGFWVSVAAYAAWLAWPRATLAASAPLALSAIIGLVAKQLDP